MLKRAFATLAMTLAVGAGSLAWGAVPVRAASCSGASHALSLSSGSVSPGSGPAGSAFTFSVTYTDNAGCAPSAVSVMVDGLGPASLATTATDFSQPVTYRASVALPAGTWSYGFTATSGSGNGARTATLTTVSPTAVVVIVPPPPPPSPTPRPTPKPTPTPRPTATPAPRSTPKPTPRPTPRPSPAAVSPGSATPSSTRAPASAATSPSPSPAAVGFAGVVGGGDGPFDGPLAGNDGLPGSGGSGPSPITLLLLSGLITLGGIGLYLVLVGATRRRDVAVPAAAEAAQAAPPPGFSYAETRGLVVSASPPDVPPEEAVIPRWRRPSLRAARQISERDVPLEHVPVLFRAGVGAAGDRRQVAYRLVRMGSEPDEFAGDEVGRLDRGDEVEVLREEAGYCLVQTPLGAVGWVHRTTLRRPEDEPSFELRLDTDP